MNSMSPSSSGTGLSTRASPAPDGPIVAVNANASDSHYEPSVGRHSAIKQGDWLSIDLWAKGLAEGSVYADITWVAYVGDSVPEPQQEIFDIVIGARNAALHYLEDAYKEGTAVLDWEADQVARGYIGSRGYGEYFTHRLGHSIGFEVQQRGGQFGRVRDPRHPPNHPRYLLLHRARHLPARVRRPLGDQRIYVCQRPLRQLPVQHEVVLIKSGCALPSLHASNTKGPG